METYQKVGLAVTSLVLGGYLLSRVACNEDIPVETASTQVEAPREYSPPQKRTPLVTRKAPVVDVPELRRELPLDPDKVIDALVDQCVADGFGENGYFSTYLDLLDEHNIPYDTFEEGLNKGALEDLCQRRVAELQEKGDDMEYGCTWNVTRQLQELRDLYPDADIPIPATSIRMHCLNLTSAEDHGYVLAQEAIAHGLSDGKGRSSFECERDGITYVVDASKDHGRSANNVFDGDDFFTATIIVDGQEVELTMSEDGLSGTSYVAGVERELDLDEAEDYYREFAEGLTSVILSHSKNVREETPECFSQVEQ